MSKYKVKERTIKILYKTILVSLSLSTAFISACSGSNSLTNASTDKALLSGGSCSEHTTVRADNPSPEDITSPSFFSCEEGTPSTSADVDGLSNTGEGDMTIGTSSVLLDTAAVEFFPESELKNHSGIQLYLHDGEVRILEKKYSFSNETGESTSRHLINWGIYSGSFVLSVELGSSATESFEGGTFEFVGYENPDDDSHIGKNMIISGIVVNDVNGDGTINPPEEFSTIVGGNINIVGSKPNWSINVDLLLDNDEPITGYFNGDYLEVPISDAGLEP